jgi:hypothetical protein
MRAGCTLGLRLANGFLLEARSEGLESRLSGRGLEEFRGGLKRSLALLSNFPESALRCALLLPADLERMRPLCCNPFLEEPGC